MAIAASGDYWNYTCIRRGRLEPLVDNDNESDDYEPWSDIVHLEYTTWSDNLSYGSLESIVHERIVRRWIHANFLH